MMGGEASRTFKDSFSRGSSCKRSPRVQRTFRILPPRFRNPRWCGSFQSPRDHRLP